MVASHNKLTDATNGVIIPDHTFTLVTECHRWFILNLIMFRIVVATIWSQIYWNSYLKIRWISGVPLGKIVEFLKLFLCVVLGVLSTKPNCGWTACHIENQVVTASSLLSSSWRILDSLAVNWQLFIAIVSNLWLALTAAERALIDHVSSFAGHLCCCLFQPQPLYLNDTRWYSS